MKKLIDWFNASRREVVYCAQGVGAIIASLGLATDAQVGRVVAYVSAAVAVLGATLALFNLSPDPLEDHFDGE